MVRPPAVAWLVAQKLLVLAASPGSMAVVLPCPAVVVPLLVAVVTLPTVLCEAA